MADCSTCPVQSAGSDGCPDSDGGEQDAPCGVCDIFGIGGVPTISPLVVDSVDWTLLHFTDFLASVERVICEAEQASGSLCCTGMPVGHLYTRLVSTSLPTRAPNA